MTASVLDARGLRRRFEEDLAVDGIDLQVGPGQIVALVGLNGAGKTTLMRLLLGMLSPDAGSVTLEGTTIADPRRTASATWARVGHLVETPSAYPELTVRENLLVCARLHGLSRAEALPATDAAITLLELDRWADRRARALSLGNRLRLGLAAALVHRPSLLVLDEPTNALDPAGVVTVRRILQAAAEGGAAVLVSSHHLDEVARIAHRIAVLHRGRIVGDIDPDGVDLERVFFRMVHEADSGPTVVA